MSGKDSTATPASASGITFLLAAIATSGLLANDIFLPLLPSLEDAWSINATDSVFLLAHFLVVMGLSHLLYPVLIERLGRRRVLLFGLALFFFASVALASMPSYGFVLFWRSLQAAGVGLSLALSRVVMRTQLPPEQSSRGFLLMATLMGIMPAVAPLLGFTLYATIGVEACFLFTSLFALFAALAVWFRVPVDEPVKVIDAGSKGFLAEYAEIAISKKFWRFASVPTFAYAAYFSYVCVSPYLLERRGLDVGEIALSYIALSATYFVGSYFARALSKSVGAEVGISVGYLFFMIGGLGFWWELEQSSFSAVRCVVEMAVLTFGNGFLLPLGTAATLGLSGHRPMLLPAILGFFQFCIAAGMAFFVSHLLTAETAFVGRTIALITLLGFASNAAVRYLERARIPATKGNIA